jgi:hypothetical protein
MNFVHILTPYLCKIQYIIILFSMSMSPKWSLLFRFSN